MASSQKRSETGEFLTFLVKLALIVFVLRSFILSPFNIPSESMQPAQVPLRRKTGKPQ